jgi:peptidoglycan/LPS O-acetylase OafA/YrhL
VNETLAPPRSDSPYTDARTAARPFWESVLAVNGAPRAPRYKSLDLWRGLACLFVVIFHSTSVWSHAAGKQPGTGVAGWLLQATRVLDMGVPMFFVISGYCISATADSSRLKGLSVGQYFVRRFRRIFPPYWAAIALQALWLLVLDVWLFPGLLSQAALSVGRPWEFSVWQWLGSLSLTEIWRWRFIGDGQGLIMGQAWTLCFEEQFYAITGLLLVALPAKRFFLGTAVVSACVLLTSFLPPSVTSGFFFGGAWLMFATGVMLYQVTNYGDRRHVAAFLVVVLLLMGFALRYGRHGLSVALLFTFLLFLLRRWDAQIATHPLLRPIVVSGQMCYSLYLTHVPIVRGISQLAYLYGITDPWITLLVVVPLATTAAAGVGWLFYLAVERRFLNRPM